MNPQPVHQSGLDLPQPTMDTNGVSPNQYELPPAPNPSAPMQQVEPPAAPVPSPTEGNNQPDYENEVVDREWIDRAEEIIDRAHSDPYLASKELSRLKAQYIKARYNKDIKIVDE